MRIEKLTNAIFFTLISGLLLSLLMGCHKVSDETDIKKTHYLAHMNKISGTLLELAYTHNEVSTVEELITIYEKEHGTFDGKSVTYYINPDITLWKNYLQDESVRKKVAIYMDLAQIGINQKERFMGMLFHGGQLEKENELSFDRSSAAKLKVKRPNISQ